jgi:ABC-type lipoprotein release transport system permease subunit
VAGSLIAHEWFGVSAVDPLTIVVALGAWFVLAWLATVGPSRAAARVEPAAVWRHV